MSAHTHANTHTAYMHTYAHSTHTHTFAQNTNTYFHKKHLYTCAINQALVLQLCAKRRVDAAVVQS